METIKIDKTEYNIPESWEELTLQNYLDIMSIPSGFTQSNKLIKIFEYAGGIPVEVSKKLSFDQLSKINKVFEWMNTLYAPAPINEFSFNGIKYKAEPISESLFGSYVDYETFIEKYGVIQGLPYLIAIMARKDGETYDDYNTYERAELFRGLPLTVALDLSCFFLTNINLTKIHTATISLLKLQIQNQRNSTLNSIENMDGRQLSLKRLQKVMLKKLMKYLDKRQPLL